MPVYNFLCHACDSGYEELTSYDPENRYDGVVCPHCGSTDKHKTMSLCAAFPKDSHDTRFWNKIDSERESLAAVRAKYGQDVAKTAIKDSDFRDPE
jgi:putative FmdB family regulatory protein